MSRRGRFSTPPGVASAEPAAAGQQTMFRVKETQKAVERQEKIFTNWVNFVLKKRNLRINSVLTDLDDGLILLQIAELLLNKTAPRHDKKPSVIAQKLSNVTIALEFFAQNGVSSNIGPKAVVSRDAKTTLGFLWVLIRQFQLGDIQSNASADTDEDLDKLERELEKAEKKAEKAEEQAAREAEIARQKANEKANIPDGQHKPTLVQVEEAKPSTFVVKQVADGCCHRCNKALAGVKSLQLDSGEKYHMNCFVCASCGKPFESGYWEHNGQPLCERHYLRKAGTRCARCGKIIRGGLTKAMDKCWHPSCFVCSACHAPFEGNFSVLDGRPYCKQDYYRRKGWLCAKCDKLVGKGDKKALGKAWHKDCFVCTTCGQPFGRDGFFDIGGKPYCPPHYKERMALRSMNP